MICLVTGEECILAVCEVEDTCAELEAVGRAALDLLRSAVKQSRSRRFDSGPRADAVAQQVEQREASAFSPLADEASALGVPPRAPGAVPRQSPRARGRRHWQGNWHDSEPTADRVPGEPHFALKVDFCRLLDSELANITPPSMRERVAGDLVHVVVLHKLLPETDLG